MQKLVRRIYGIDRMVKPEHVLGEIPSSKEMYTDVARIATPSVLEMVFMSLMGSLDTMMVGALGNDGSDLGIRAIAAIGLTGQPRMLMLSLFFAMNIGVTAIVARRKGQQLRDEANRTMRNALVLIAIMSLVMMGLALTFSRELLLFAGAQADTIDLSVQYFNILAYVLPINALTMSINAAQRGVGNTKITMVVNITANLVNVVFNYLLISGNFGFPRLEVAGAAIATAIGFCVGFVLALISIVGKKSQSSFLHLSKKDSWRPHKETLISISKVGSNAMLEQIAMRFGFFVYARIVAGLGTAVFAAHQIGMQFTSLSFTFGDGIGVAGTSLVGQMLGRKRPDLSMIYGKISQRIAMTAAFIMLSVMIALRYPLAGLFTKDVFVWNLAADLLIMVAIFQPFQTSSVVISGCLRGAGDTRYVAMVMLLCVSVIRPVLAYVAVNYLHLGIIGAWAASLVDMVIRLAATYKRFSSNKWATIKV